MYPKNVDNYNNNNNKKEEVSKGFKTKSNINEVDDNMINRIKRKARQSRRRYMRYKSRAKRRYSARWWYCFIKCG